MCFCRDLIEQYSGSVCQLQGSVVTVTSCRKSVDKAQGVKPRQRLNQTPGGKQRYGAVTPPLHVVYIERSVADHMLAELWVGVNITDSL